MSLKIKKKSGSSVPPMEAGTYPAVCVGIVDLGEQYSETFKKYSDKLLVIWEIPSQTIETTGRTSPAGSARTSPHPLTKRATSTRPWFPGEGRRSQKTS